MRKDVTSLSIVEDAHLDYVSSMYIAILVYGDDYDDLVISALEKFADYCDSYQEKANPDNNENYENNVFINHTRSTFARLYILILENDFEAAKNYALEHSDDVLFGDAMYTEIYLMRGDAENAAVIQNYYFDLLKNDIADGFSLQLDLTAHYVFEKRGIMDRETILKYLDLLSVKFVYEIIDPYGNALEAGVKAGDIITAVNGGKIYSQDQILDMLHSNNHADIEIIRENEVLQFSINKDARNEYGFGVSYTVY